MSSDSKELLQEIAHLRGELENKNNEISQLKLEKDDLANQLSSRETDSLTELLVRPSWRAKCLEIIKEAGGETDVCLILIDIDNFKVLNDKHGHAVADKILKEFGELLKETARVADCVTRYGGGEFAVLVKKPITVAYDLAELIRVQTETNRWNELQGYPVTVSLGVAQIKAGQTFDDLVTEADRCLYAAKSEGRNRVVTDVDLNSDAEDRGEDLILSDMENRIRVVTERLTRYMIIRSKRTADYYKQEAARDALTGVYNRGYLDRLLTRELDKAKREGRSLVVVMIDIDDFGQINKLHNWTAGDLAVKAVSAVIQKQVRANDWVARYGGDEFIAVMPDTEKAEGVAAAERIRRAVETTSMRIANDVEFQVTASIGVVVCDSSIKSCQGVYELVGNAARSAKENGKNNVVYL